MIALIVISIVASVISVYQWTKKSKHMSQQAA